MYVLDTKTIEVFSNDYPDQFPSFWDSLEKLITTAQITSVRQVKQELERRTADDHLVRWVARHEGLFPTPSRSHGEGP